jgi:hypothetical protein
MLSKRYIAKHVRLFFLRITEFHRAVRYYYYNYLIFIFSFLLLIGK